MKKWHNLTYYLILIPILIQAQFIGTSQGDHSIVTKANGTIYTWGYNIYGQLGNGATTQSSVPIAVTISGKTITQIAGGYLHSIALASDGTVYTWGANHYGQLGNGNTGTHSKVPIAVTISGKTITQVAGGTYHSIALASDGTIYTWGYNYYGQLGNGNTGTDSNVPVAVTISGKTITHVAGGYHHSIALASDGTVYTWGRNNYGQLGNGNTGTLSNVPVAVTISGKTITQVAAGKYHNIALASDSTIYTWGYNYYGQLGNGSGGFGTESNVPVVVTISGKTITQVAGANYHSIALASDGTIYTWGYNYYGQLGNGASGSDSDSNVPVSVTISGKTITQVAAGNYHSIALASDGTIYTWGYNDYGQLGNGASGSGTNSSVPVAVDQSGMGSLPVELTTFSANVNGSEVILNWQTATEINNYGFEIERQTVETLRATTNEWEKIGFVEGHGNSNSPKDYTFTDNLLNLNLDLNLSYRLKQVDFDGNYEYSAVVEVTLTEIVKEYKLEQNFPNPFNPSTVIKYSIPTDVKSEMSNVKLVVYDILGNEVATLVNENKSAGNYEVKFDASNLSSGIYLYKLQSGSFIQTRKLMLLK